MATLLSCFVLLCVFAAIESGTLRLKNIPITPEGISLRIVVKEDAKTGLPVASLKIAMGEGRKHATLAPPTVNLTTERTTKDVTTEVSEKVEDPSDESIPSEALTFGSRFGIGAVKCPKGRKRIGQLCHPVG